MKVTVLGSWREQDAKEWHLKDPALFPAACRRLGAHIVRQGHELIAASDREDTADFHAVEGALEELKAQGIVGPRIRLFGERTAFAKWSTEALPWVTAESSPEAAWEHAKLFQVKLSDAVITVAGAAGTFHAGFAAGVAEKQVIPIGCFGGAGRKLVELFKQTEAHWTHLPPKDLLGILAFPWQDSTGDQITALLGTARRAPRIVIVHGRSPHRDQLRHLLVQGMGLPEPILMREEFLPGATLIEKWQSVAQRGDGAIALVTPDDVGGLANETFAPNTSEKRARENVWIEAGWVWGRLGLKRLLLLRQDDTRIPSDLLGIDHAQYQNDPQEAGETIFKFVQSLREEL